VNGLEVEVADTAIGRVVGQTDALEEVHLAEGLVRPPILQARETVSVFGHARLAPHRDPSL
jgi:hypothetical protein